MLQLARDKSILSRQQSQQVRLDNNRYRCARELGVGELSATQCKSATKTAAKHQNQLPAERAASAQSLPAANSCCGQLLRLAKCEQSNHLFVATTTNANTTNGFHSHRQKPMTESLFTLCFSMLATFSLHLRREQLSKCCCCC